MKVEIVIDEECSEPCIQVITREITPELNELVKRLAEPGGQFLIGYQDDRLELLQPEAIVRIFSENQKVLAQTDTGTYSLRMRLYEAEERLGAAGFVRISNAEIVNFRKVKNLDMSLGGTICILFLSGQKTYVSRRYVSKIKAFLGI